MPGVIFDLDGTLLDTLEDISFACNTVFAQMGIAPKSAEEYRPWIGRGLRMLVSSALGEAKEDIDEVWERIVAVYAQNPTSRTSPYPGIESLLERLSGEGYALAILSNKEDHLVKTIVKQLFPRVAFREVRGLSAKYPAKPDPTQALEIAEILSCTPSDVYFIGDSPYDVETARRAKMIPVAVTWGYIVDSNYCRQGECTLCNDAQELYRFISSPS